VIETLCHSLALLQHETWMQRALQLADQAALQGEVPVGAVLVRDGECLGEGWNQSIQDHDPSAHAEIKALRTAALKVSNYRLPGSVLYVTLEPCVMCVGAMIHARIEHLVFGAFDQKTGAAGSVFQLLQAPQHNHQIACTGGILEQDCAARLQQFFRTRRQAKKQARAQSKSTWLMFKKPIQTQGYFHEINQPPFVPR